MGSDEYQLSFEDAWGKQLRSADAGRKLRRQHALLQHSMAAYPLSTACTWGSAWTCEMDGAEHERDGCAEGRRA